jgi:YidC/Oxa1 family membrane protein insertase
MENRRFILIALLGVVLFFMYQAWQKDYAPQPHAPVEAASPAVNTVEDIPTAQPTAATSAADGAAPTVPGTAADTRIVFETDLYAGEIALNGGELRRLELKAYPLSKDHPDRPMALLDDRNGRLFVVQSGLAGTADALVSHRTRFTTAQPRYVMADGADSLDVVLEYRSADGVTVRKIYRFKRGSYGVELRHEVDNAAVAELRLSPYARLTRNAFKAGDEPPFVATFTGVGFYEQKEGGSGYRFKKTSLGDLAEDAYDVQQPGGWIALLQHYFVAAIVPAQDQTGHYSAKIGQNASYSAQYVGPMTAVAAGASHAFSTPLYLGPKLQDSIGQYAPGLELTVDYGILTAISEPLFWLLSWFHSLTGNWGWAIILLTIVVKALMYKLSEAQYRSMAKMKKFAPKIQDLKDRHGDDRERMQKAMMDLYKKEGFNPLAGCWPLLVQFPVFIALYWVLLESVELRQAPFALWLQDLTSPDPYYVLPVLFGLSMFFQQRLSGTQAMDPMQQKIMNVMPIMLTAFFAFFQSGLVLYWFTSNLIGIAQQWYITRKLEREDALKAATKR